jgi:hypothetical protein
MNKSQIKFGLGGFLIGIIFIILIIYLMKKSSYQFVQMAYCELINNKYQKQQQFV